VLVVVVVVVLLLLLVDSQMRRAESGESDPPATVSGYKRGGLGADRPRREISFPAA